MREIRIYFAVISKTTGRDVSIHFWDDFRSKITYEHINCVGVCVCACVRASGQVDYFYVNSTVSFGSLSDLFLSLKYIFNNYRPNIPKFSIFVDVSVCNYIREI